MDSRVQSTVGCFPELFFFRGGGACGVAKAIYKQLCLGPVHLDIIIIILRLGSNRCAAALVVINICSSLPKMCATE